MEIDKVSSIEVNGNTYWLQEGIEDLERRYFKTIEEIMWAKIFAGVDCLPIEKIIEIYRRNDLEYKPEQHTSRIGRYVMTDKGMMYEAHGKLFTIVDSEYGVSDKPYDGEVTVIRDCTSFDF